MTLPELLICIVVIGIIATVISASVMVTMRSQQTTDGRLNVARSEQAVTMWLPADLSSAVDAKDGPADSPCGAPTCPGVGPLGGSNALLLNWPSDTGAGTTTVGYIYRLEGGGPLYELVRVECDAGSCTAATVLHDLAGPPVDEFVPGVTPVPSDVINVALPPLQAGATDETLTDTASKARRIVVTINGGGGSDGAGGGVNRVSITAGGTNTTTLEPDKVTGPSFLKATSRCGGPITIIVDDSGSIATGGGSALVENAVREFVKALAGTPTKVQIIKFSNRSSQLAGSAAPAGGYYDMTNSTQVYSLTGDDSGLPEPGLIRTRLVQSGGTNWEDAIYRTFYSSSQIGVTLPEDGDPTTFLPGLVVFFTDGEPTRNMTSGTSYRSIANAPTGPVVYTKPKWPNPNGNAFDQEGYDRAEHWLAPFRNTESTRLIGVGVGAIATNQVFTFKDSVVQTHQYGLIYGTGTSTSSTYPPQRVFRRNSSGSPTLPALATNTSTEKVLGNFIAGGLLWEPGDAQYVKATYSGGQWTNAKTANLYINSNFSALASALTTIAVGECGGTLSVQTRLPDGSLATNNVTYERNETETVTTSQAARAATYDLQFAVPPVPLTSLVKPQSLDAIGYAAQSWSCSLKNVPLDPAKWSLVNPVNPADGINVTVEPNEAVSCTLTVVPT